MSVILNIAFTPNYSPELTGEFNCNFFFTTGKGKLYMKYPNGKGSGGEFPTPLFHVSPAILNRLIYKTLWGSDL